jgi:hypothetical protein
MFVGAGLAAALVVAWSADETNEAVADQQATEAEDLTVTECAADPTLNLLKVTTSITNNSSKRSSYNIEVTVESPDQATKYGTAVGFVTGVEPGQTTTSDLLSADPVPAGEFACRVVEVDRTSDVG